MILVTITYPVCGGTGVFVDDLGYTISRHCPCCKAKRVIKKPIEENLGG